MMKVAQSTLCDFYYLRCCSFILLAAADVESGGVDEMSESLAGGADWNRRFEGREPGCTRQPLEPCLAVLAFVFALRRSRSIVGTMTSRARSIGGFCGLAMCDTTIYGSDDGDRRRRGRSGNGGGDSSDNRRRFEETVRAYRGLLTVKNPARILGDASRIYDLVYQTMRVDG
jgi:hypothetical protein